MVKILKRTFLQSNVDKIHELFQSSEGLAEEFESIILMKCTLNPCHSDYKYKYLLLNYTRSRALLDTKLFVGECF